ncbi:MAG TPA: GlsB/YeaQ/YmgE family stress response membrane protein [Candidatus Deferrimicrobium sp.]|nr:GlsB/YeaQ/YmgE family stress response membrane protein [Candidatus Deferrimicrobium sp.]
MEVIVGIIAWIVLGAIAGYITNMIMGGKEGVIATIALGIVGAVVGGWLAGTVLKLADVTGVNVESIVVSVIGAVIVVAVYRLVIGRRASV